jgi:hypothetical protein
VFRSFVEKAIFKNRRRRNRIANSKKFVIIYRPPFLAHMWGILWIMRFPIWWIRRLIHFPTAEGDECFQRKSEVLHRFLFLGQRSCIVKQNSKICLRKLPKITFLFAVCMDVQNLIGWGNSTGRLGDFCHVPKTWRIISSSLLTHLNRPWRIIENRDQRRSKGTQFEQQEEGIAFFALYLFCK